MGIASAEDRLKQYQPLWENWFVDSLIYNGANSRVFKIKRERDGEVEFSALKMITILPDNDMLISKSESERYLEDKCQRAKVEISNMIKLRRCPYVVSYYDDAMREIHDETGEKAGYDILIRMEYLECFGHAIRKSDKEITVQDVVNLGYDVGNALKDVHKNNMIHRDIKPDNIFIDTEGYYKLGDLGVSKTINATGFTSTRTGTEPYAAPEVWRQDNMTEHAYTYRADIYSFGIVLYQLLNNNLLPFMTDFTRNEIEKSVSMRMRGEKVPEPANGSPQLKELVCKMCEFNPDNRLADMKSFLRALEDIADRSEENSSEVLSVEGQIPEDMLETADANEGYYVPESAVSKHSDDVVNYEQIEEDIYSQESVWMSTVIEDSTSYNSMTQSSGNSDSQPEAFSTVSGTQQPVSQPEAFSTVSGTQQPVSQPEAFSTVSETQQPVSQPEAFSTVSGTQQPVSQPEVFSTVSGTQQPVSQPETFSTVSGTQQPVSQPEAFSTVSETQQSVSQPEVFSTVSGTQQPVSQPEVFSTVSGTQQPVSQPEAFSTVSETQQPVSQPEVFSTVSETQQPVSQPEDVYKEIYTTTIPREPIRHRKGLSVVSDSTVFRRKDYHSIGVENGLLDIPEGYTQVEAFAEHEIERDLITEINIPKTVTTLISGVFKDFKNLKKVNIQGNLKILKSKTFEGCSSLENIILPESLVRIEDNAFMGCENLKYVEAHKGISSMGKNIFEECRDVTVICPENSQIETYCINHQIKTEKLQEGTGE